MAAHRGTRLSTKKLPWRERLIVALDTPDAEDARKLVEHLGEEVIFYKIGLELFMAGGYFDLLDWLQDKGKKVWGCPRSLSLVCQFDPFFELSQALLGRSFVETPFALFEEQMEVVFGNAVEFS